MRWGSCGACFVGGKRLSWGERPLVLVRRGLVSPCVGLPEVGAVPFVSWGEGADGAGVTRVVGGASGPAVFLPF